ncbi:hypothetical protein PV703_26350 [Streptomyces sp. ME01-24h]|nr:hypothetical protein [Streptomyces sp. ME01-24h]
MPTEQPDARAIVDTFCATLDPLAYPARMRALAAWVRRVVNDRDSRGSALRPLLDELDARGAYERRLAVSAAAIGGDVAFLQARLTDPDAVVRATGDGRLGRPAVAKVRGGRERPGMHRAARSSRTVGVVHHHRAGPAGREVGARARAATARVRTGLPAPLPAGSSPGTSGCRVGVAAAAATPPRPGRDSSRRVRRGRQPRK